MTVLTLHILAENNGLGGVIVIAVMIIGWAIKAMSSLQQKQKEREQQMLQELRAASPPAPPSAAPVPVAQRSPAAVEIAQQMMRRARAMAAAQQQPARMPAKLGKPGVPIPRRRVAASPQLPPLPVPRQQAPREIPEPPRPVTKKAAPAVARTTQASGAVSATAPVIRKWLRPGTLRSQFILTEIFQKPVAMRDDHLV